MDYAITDESDAESLPADVRSSIRTADPADVGPRDYRPIALALRAADGSLLGGLYGATMWKWLMIDGLWVAEQVRGRGLGRRVLLAAEATAIERGCRGSWLGTFDFQAREFYERLGYAVFAELPGFPPGHTHYHLQKVLKPA